ncbi:MAG: NAD+ synthase [Roseofilum sp. SBFL]|uniref:NAD+ synthase n=1 Tax=unclassified Roseofilum TaxID=2620099 RepID=UPI001B27642C|nr:MULTISPECIES: NAD+ synthase [unclassified Roseofilum]MBP0014086.1 NAD+ synthase [Roseofilum sp. SID3]MBP0026711.1 NAD+ synthase [Roseofilum sp. SID2]MBP0038541.1 NAD+ synthase [Roseofilum sp. SID1]MBP0040782.1 NAD+ synthase [Roseofilum sp. SBFL]
MKIAIAQLNPTIGDLEKNARTILKSAEIAAAQGALVLLTPELSLCGYPPRDLLNYPVFIDKMNHLIEDLARKIPPDLIVCVGTVSRNLAATKQGGKELFNSVVALYKGKVLAEFHKRLLPTYDVFDEDRYFEPGHESQVLAIHTDRVNLRIGVTICEDLWNDEQFWGKRSYPINPLADLMDKNVDIVVNLSASPYSLNKPVLRRSMLSYSASRYQVPIIYVNQVGGNDDLIFDGHSLAVNQTGKVVAQLPGFKSDFQVLTFDQKQQDLLGDSQPLSEDENLEIWSALVLGVRDYACKCGFGQIVLGLSGGIDSALVAAIAAEAIGPSEVLGVLMPSPYSSEHSITDALQLAQNLGIQTQILAIGDLMSSFDCTLDPLFAQTKPGVAEENIQSRIRGNLLMAIANKFGHLLLSTGNKSEMAVGYCTLYGDMDGGLAAIADVPKTRVYSLCRWLNQRSGKEIIPEHILVKPPSAELKPDQCDRDSLPDYDTLDDILHRLIHDHQSPETIADAGHDPAIINKVLHLVKRAEFKRRQAPPGLKITSRAFGTGWRMPIAAKGIPSLRSQE